MEDTVRLTKGAKRAQTTQKCASNIWIQIHDNIRVQVGRPNPFGKRKRSGFAIAPIQEQIGDFRMEHLHSAERFGYPSHTHTGPLRAEQRPQSEWHLEATPFLVEATEQSHKRPDNKPYKVCSTFPLPSRHTQIPLRQISLIVSLDPLFCFYKSLWLLTSVTAVSWEHPSWICWSGEL